MIRATSSSPSASASSEITHSDSSPKPDKDITHQECNPHPSFPPSKTASRQAIIPSYLLRQAQQMRANQSGTEADPDGQKSIEISDRMREQRKHIYSPQ